MKHAVALLVCLLALSACNTSEKYAANRLAGQKWLDANRGRATADFSGSWESVSDNWGATRFVQSGSSISGAMGSYSVKGVVRGRRAYLTLESGGWIYYTAIVTHRGDGFYGFYSSSVPFSSSDQAAMTFRRVRF